MTLVWLAYFSIAELLSLMPSRPSSCILLSEKAVSENYSVNFACASMHEAIFRMIRFIWDNASHDNVIALGTVLIALFTFVLYRSTNKLWLAGEKQIEVARIAAEAARTSAEHIPNVERAFVFFASATCDGLNDPSGTFLLAKYSFKNSGRTPAILSRIQIGAEYLEDAPTRDTKFTYGDGHLPAPQIIGGDNTPPENDVQLWITGLDYEKAKVGNGRIFFWGKLTYHDVFGASHETGMCSEWHFIQSRFVISTDCKELNYYT